MKDQDRSRPEANGFGAYHPHELELLSTVLRDIMVDFDGDRGASGADDREALRNRLAVALFRCAANGDRDAASLRQRAIAMVRNDAN